MPERSNRTVIDADGFRLYLTVGGSTTYDRDRYIDLTMAVENRTDQPRDYDTNTLRQFEFRRGGNPAVVWDDTRCRRGQTPPDRLITGVLVLQPGRTASFSDTYPRNRTAQAGHPPDCLLAAGEYDVVGVFTWCPPGSVRDGTCYPDRVAEVRTAAVKLTLT